MFETSLERVVNTISDQASGLRQLFNTQSLRVLPISGSSQLVELLARTLAADSRVVVIDEQGSAIVDAFRKSARYELSDLLSGSQEFAEVAVPINDQLSVLSAQTGLQQFLKYAQQHDLSAESLFSGFMGLSRPFQWLLINTIELKSAAALVRSQGELLLVLSDTSTAITEAYAQIKQAVIESPDMQLRIAIQSDSDAQAKRIFRSLAQTSERFFHLQPQFALRLPSRWKVSSSMAEKLRLAMYSWSLAEYVQTSSSAYHTAMSETE